MGLGVSKKSFRSPKAANMIRVCCLCRSMSTPCYLRVFLISFGQNKQGIFCFKGMNLLLFRTQVHPLTHVSSAFLFPEHTMMVPTVILCRPELPSFNNIGVKTIGHNMCCSYQGRIVNNVNMYKNIAMLLGTYHKPVYRQVIKLLLTTNFSSFMRHKSVK